MPDTNPTPIFDFIKQVEKELLALIEEKVEQTSLTIEEAATLAHDFLTALPVLNRQELCDKLHHLYTSHPVCCPLYIKYARTFEEWASIKKATILQQMLEQNAIIKAYALVEGGVL